MQHTAIFHGCKNDNFQLKFLDYFHIFAQNIDYGYTLESPQLEPLNVVRQRNSIFLKKRAIAYIENVFVYSDRYGHSNLKSD